MFQAIKILPKALLLQKIVFTLPIILALAAFSIPISSTLKSIFIPLSVGLTFFLPDFKLTLSSILKRRWCQATIALFLMTIMGCLWSPATLKEQLLIIEKFSKLLYLPILVIGFQNEKNRRLTLNAFIFAMALTCLIALIKYNGFVNLGDSDDYGSVFRNHIMTGLMVSFAAYCSIYLAFSYSGRKKAIYLSLFVLFTIEIWFLNTGRTGYVMYTLLMVLFFIQKLSIRQALLCATLTAASIMALYGLSDSFNNSIQQVIKDVHAYQVNQKNSSLGYRLQFHAFAQDLFLRKPVLGQGTAGFTHQFDKEKPAPTWDRRLLEPHSQYWLMISEYGLVGFFALAFFFISLFIAVLKLNFYRPIALALWISFLIGNLSDSLLLYSGTGYLFILMMALCLGEA